MPIIHTSSLHGSTIGDSSPSLQSDDKLPHPSQLITTQEHTSKCSLGTQHTPLTSLLA